MVTFVSTAQTLLDLSENRADASDSQVWAKYEATHRRLFDVYYTSKSGPDGRETDRVPLGEVLALLPERDARARAVTHDITRTLARMGLSPTTDWQVALIVGNGASNAWVTDVEGQLTLFLALELFPDPPYDAVLVAHEAVHLLHRDDDGWDNTISSRLWCEGIAVALSRLVVPGLPDTAYLWFEDRSDAWAERCIALQRRLDDLVSLHLASTRETLMTSLFGMPGHSPMPDRCGYWLADLLIRLLMSTGVQPSELANADATEARQHLERALKHERTRTPPSA